MGNAHNITAFILLLFGLYSVAAAIGELRKPGTWARMMWELERSRALRFLTGIFCFALGAAIYLVNPYDGLDMQSILVTILGGFMMIEGLAFLAFPDLIMRFAKLFMDNRSSIWAWFALLIGIALLCMSYVRMLAS